MRLKHASSIGKGKLYKKGKMDQQGKMIYFLVLFKFIEKPFRQMGSVWSLWVPTYLHALPNDIQTYRHTDLQT